MLAGVCNFERGLRCLVRVETVRQSDCGGRAVGRQQLLDKEDAEIKASQAITV